MITEPGIYQVDESAYNSDADLAPALGRSLSQSGAKVLLASPERFAHERDHGRPSKRAFDVGSLTHALILRSKDDRIDIVDAYDWRTKAAQTRQAESRAAQRIPVHRGDLLAASKVARAVRRHPLAGAIFAHGRPEVSMYWRDAETGVTCRGRIDWVHERALVDLKTVGRYGGADPGAFGRAAASFDYPMQAAAYTEGWGALTGEMLDFVTVAVELDPPHFVTVGRYSTADIEAGRERWRAALRIFADRESSGVWVDPPAIRTIPVPGWYGRTPIQGDIDEY